VVPSRYRHTDRTHEIPARFHFLEFQALIRFRLTQRYL